MGSFDPTSSHSSSRVLPPAGRDAGRHRRVPEIRQGHACHNSALSAPLPGRLPAHQLVQVLVLHSWLCGGPHQKEGIDRWGRSGAAQTMHSCTPLSGTYFALHFNIWEVAKDLSSASTDEPLWDVRSETCIWFLTAQSRSLCCPSVTWATPVHRSHV